MFQGLPYKTKQFFFVLIKLSIVAGALYFIYQKLFKNEKFDFDLFLQFLIKNDVFSLKNVLFLSILTIFNWFFEILKWRNLVSVVTKITFYTAFKQSLSSLTASLLTPNRIGDYAAKAIQYERTLRKRILMLNLISNMAQMGATLLFGCIGLYLFIGKYDVAVSGYKVGRFVVIITFIAIFTLFGLKKDTLTFRGFSSKKIFLFLESIPRSIHLKNILYSVIRYLIFSFQFFLLLSIFGVEISYYNAMVAISTMYLLSSIIPTIFIFDVVIKGSIALYLFDLAGVNGFTILCVVTTMWILNFAIPAVIGSSFVIKFKTLKTVETR